MSLSQYREGGIFVSNWRRTYFVCKRDADREIEIRKREMSRIKAWGLSLLVAYLFLVLARLVGILIGLLT